MAQAVTLGEHTLEVTLTERNGRLTVRATGIRNELGAVVLATGKFYRNTVTGRLGIAAEAIDWVAMYRAQAPVAAAVATKPATRTELCRRCGSYCYGDCQSYR